MQRAIKRVQARIAQLKVVLPFCANDAIQRRIDYHEAYKRDLFKLSADLGRHFSGIVDRMCQDTPHCARKVAYNVGSARVSKLLVYAQVHLGLRGRLAFGFKH
jgi:hypothetical protein